MRQLLETVLTWRVQARLKLWLLQVRLVALATRSTVEIDVHPTVRVGKRTRVQFDRNTRNRLVVGAKTNLRDDVMLQLRGGTIEIGSNCDIREACRFNVTGHLVLAGQNVFSWGCTIHCTDRIVIGQMTSCSEYVTIVDSRHYHSGDGRWFYSNTTSRPVEIGRNVWLAAKCTVTMGTQIGDDALVATNSVARGVVEAGTVVAGVPAKPAGSSLR
ncbi:MAG TPA: acyltransferase [Acidimicrobiales bacterium]|jgi:galactoside O-acetyltransferase|nr:acyltransferase [Acidimicrobiales bacterium]